MSFGQTIELAFILANSLYWEKKKTLAAQSEILAFPKACVTSAERGGKDGG